jgi:hypothetical protein
MKFGNKAKVFWYNSITIFAIPHCERAKSEAIVLGLNRTETCAYNGFHVLVLLKNLSRVILSTMTIKHAKIL